MAIRMTARRPRRSRLRMAATVSEFAVPRALALGGLVVGYLVTFVLLGGATG